MVTLLTILHVFVCVFLIFVVLLQPGKSGGMGAAFGGASQAVFGARGATSFLGKVTAVCAVIFMLTSIGLSYLATSKEKSLRAESERQEERAKARRISPTKAAKTTKQQGGMSSPEESDEAPTKAPARDEGAADEGAGDNAAPANDEGAANEPAPAPAPAKATKNAPARQGGGE